MFLQNRLRVHMNPQGDRWGGGLWGALGSFSLSIKQGIGALHIKLRATGGTKTRTPLCQEKKEAALSHQRDPLSLSLSLSLFPTLFPEFSSS